MERLELQPLEVWKQGTMVQCSTSVENPGKQVHFEVGKELGEEPNLPTDITLFLAESASTKQTTTPSSLAQLPTPAKNPTIAMTRQKGPKLKFQL